MFGMTPKSTLPALEQNQKIFEGLDLSAATPEDLAWGTKFYKAAQSSKSYKARKLLHTALTNEQHMRLAMGLHIQKQFPEKDFLYANNPTTLYSAIWKADPRITRMYIETYYPSKASLTLDWSIDLKPIFEDLAPSTCMKWAERGCEAFVNPLFYSLVKNGTADQIETFCALEGKNLNTNYGNNAGLKEALKREDPEIIQIVLNQKPSLNLDTIEILELALQSDKTDGLKLLIENGINILRQDEAIFKIAEANQRLAHLEILNAAKHDMTAQSLPLLSQKPVDGWRALSATFAEYQCPANDDGSKAKYQVNFDNGYMTYHYETKDQVAPPVLKTIAETYAENPQLIDKAVSAITAHDFPAPDLSPFFNKAGAKSFRQVEKPVAAPVKHRSNNR